MKVVEGQTNCGSLISGSTVEMHYLAGKGEAGKAERRVCEQAGQGERTVPSKACTAVILLECDGGRTMAGRYIRRGTSRSVAGEVLTQCWHSTGRLSCFAPRPPACLCYHH